MGSSHFSDQMTGSDSGAFDSRKLAVFERMIGMKRVLYPL